MADKELSKNAQKKLLKAEEAAKKKAAKEAEKLAIKAATPKENKLSSDEAEELDPTQYFENRLKAISSMEVELFVFSQKQN